MASESRINVGRYLAEVGHVLPRHFVVAAESLAVPKNTLHQHAAGFFQRKPKYNLQGGDNMNSWSTEKLHIIRASFLLTAGKGQKCKLNIQYLVSDEREGKERQVKCTGTQQ